jgi:hypothetical protein
MMNYLSKELVDRFKKWIELYDKTFILFSLGEEKTIKKTKIDRIRKMGHKLAKDLQKLFPTKIVWYCFEDMSGTSRPTKVST